MTKWLRSLESGVKRGEKNFIDNLIIFKHKTMKTNYNPETGKTTWELNKWYQKTIYVMGFIALIIWSISFIYGFIIGIA